SDHASGAVPHYGRCGALRAPSGGCLLARDASLLSWPTACALARSRGSHCCGRTVAGGVSLAIAATLAPALARAAPAGGDALWLREAVVTRLHTTDTKPRMSTSVLLPCLPSVWQSCWQGVWHSWPGCSTACM